MVGETIAHFRILEALGGGGMGVVYKARDLKLDRLVALKFLSAELSLDSAGKERFAREAKAASALDHPNICTIFEINETENGQMYIAMAYYEGETLKLAIDNCQLTIDNSIDIALQIARGLAHAHRQGIIHRDLKPGNVMIASGGAAKILDFGLAKFAGSAPVTGSGAMMGTAAYMSPEQLRGETADQRSDIWSFGVVLFEMLAGKTPFEAEHPQTTFYRILNEKPPPLRSLNPEVPPELEKIVNRALQKDSAQRYAAVDEMLAELEAVQRQASASSSGEFTGLKKPLPGKSLFSKIPAAALLIFLLIAGIYLLNTILRNRADKGPPEIERRIAVLPFENISPEAQDEYFSDGITEELISTLSNIHDLKVIARTSVMQYKDVPKSISQIGRELNVSRVIRGSVRKYADRLRITVQLVDVSSETNLWSQEYDRELKDIFEIQRDIARSVSQTLKIHLKEKEKNRLAGTTAGNLEAYEFYLKGRYYLNKRTPSSILKGMKHLQAAIAKDSSLVLAYTGLADAYSLLGSTEYGAMPPDIARPRAREAALKALRLDEASSEAHLSLADIFLFYDWNWPEAEKYFQRAIALNPNDAAAHHWYALYYISLGKAEKAFEELYIAYNLDPISPVINLDIGWTHYYFGQYDLAIRQLQETLELDQYFILAYIALAFTYDIQMHHPEALATIKRAQELAGDYPLVTAVRAYILARAGKKTEANILLQELLPLAEGKDTYLPSLFIAMIYLGLEDRDSAFRWIDKAYRERCNFLLYFKVDPKLDPLRPDPRFIQLMKKIGFKD